MKLSFKPIFTAAVYAALSAAVVNAVLFAAFHAAGFITDDILLQPANEPMTIIPIVMSSIVPTLLSAVAFFLLEKYTAKGFRNFSILALVLLLVSFANPFVGIPGVTLAYAMALNVMHVVVVGSILYFYRKLYQRKVAVA